MLTAIASRPEKQSVIVSGDGVSLKDIMDAVSEVKGTKHAFRAGIKAHKDIDY